MFYNYTSSRCSVKRSNSTCFILIGNWFVIVVAVGSWCFRRWNVNIMSIIILLYIIIYYNIIIILLLYYYIVLTGFICLLMKYINFIMESCANVFSHSSIGNLTRSLASLVRSLTVGEGWRIRSCFFLKSENPIRSKSESVIDIWRVWDALSTPSYKSTFSPSKFSQLQQRWLVWYHNCKFRIHDTFLSKSDDIISQLRKSDGPTIRLRDKFMNPKTWTS